MPKLPSLLILAGLVVVTAAPVVAQDSAPASHPSRRARRPRPPSVLASFPGFRMNGDGTSQCFVTLSAPVEATTNASPRRFEVLLPGVGVAARNHLQPLETRFFNTPMTRARLERRGRSDLVLIVELRGDVTPTLRTEAVEGGGTRVIVDLPAGHYVDGPPQLGGDVRVHEDDPDMGSSGVGRTEDRSRSGTDQERPPSFR